MKLGAHIGVGILKKLGPLSLGLFLLSIYILDLLKGWQGKKPAAIASIGFFVVWICYLGVNLLGKGLHSYGWVSVT